MHIMYYCRRCVRSVAIPSVHVFVKYFWCGSNFFLFFVKEENVHCLFCSRLKYSKNRKARDEKHMCARICAFVLFPDEWPSVRLNCLEFFTKAKFVSLLSLFS